MTKDIIIANYYATSQLLRHFSHYQLPRPVRLDSLGLLSVIWPGTFTQTSCGIIMGSFHLILLALAKPYIEWRDNMISILASTQVILILRSADFMMIMNRTQSDYDSKYMGFLLMFCYVVIFLLFLMWAYLQKDDMRSSSAGLAVKVLKGKEITVGETSNVNRVMEPKFTERRESHFEGKNPIFAKTFKTNSDGLLTLKGNVAL